MFFLRAYKDIFIELFLHYIITVGSGIKIISTQKSVKTSK
jgi:hypothetical protein